MTARRTLVLGFAILASVSVLAGLVALVDHLDDARVIAVRATDDDRQLEVSLDTCNADVSVEVEEHEDRVVVRATHHDWYRYLTGSDDCADGVAVDLDAPLGSRALVTPN